MTRRSGATSAARASRARRLLLRFAGGGYLSQGELYRLGALTTAFNLLVYLVVGAPWLIFLSR